MFWPEFGENAELRSLKYYAGKRVGLEGVEPPCSLLNIIINDVVSHLQCLKWEVPSDFLTYDHFIRELQEVDPNSSPGYPYCLSRSNNRQYLGLTGSTYDEQKVKDLYQSCLNYISGELGADPIRLFIKPEPVSLKKYENKAYRLISSVSIRDRMVDAMLFGEMNRLVVEKWVESSIKVGWTPVGGGWKFMSYLPQQAADRSGWDWSVKGWLLEATLEIRKRLMKGSNNLWIDLATKRYKDLFLNPLFVTSKGLFLKQLQAGVQKSGCFNTIIDNSIMQLLLHAFACRSLDLDWGVIIAVGDDTLQTTQPQRYYDFLRKYCYLKEVENVSEFCGFRFLPGGIVDPVHFSKHMFNIKYMSPKVAESMSLSYSVVYHRSSKKSLMKSIFRTCGYHPLSEFELDVIWDE